MRIEEVIIFTDLALASTVALMLYVRYRSLPVSLKYMAHYMLSQVVFQFGGMYLNRLELTNTQLYMVALLVFYGFTYLILRQFIHVKSRKLISIIFFIGALSIGYQFFDARLGLLHTAFSKAVLIENLVVVSASLLIYFEMLKNVSKNSLHRQWKFFLVTGFLFYSLSSSGYWGILRIAITYDIRIDIVESVNVFLYLIQLLIFLWAVRVYIVESKLSKI